MDAQESPVEDLPTFFLDTIPGEVLDYVLRFFSRIPAAKNWERHIPLGDLVALFRVNGHLGTLMKSRFTALCVSNTGDCISEKNEYHWEIPTQGMLSTDDINVARAYILAGGGQALRTLAIGLRMRREEKDDTDIVHDFADNCPNVTSLSIHDMGTAWVSRFGKQLKKLEFATFSASGISQYCTSLRELNLNLYSHSSNTGDDDLWEKVGDKLEKLTLKCVDRVLVDHLEKIQQLKSAYLYGMGENEVRDVANACRNASFHLRPVRDTPILPSLLILEHQLESIHVQYDSEVRDFDEFKKAWDGCVNLRQLHVKGCNVEDMKAVMSTPKIQLQELNLQMWHLKKRAVKEVLDICSNACDNIEEITYNGPHLPVDAFDKFLQKSDTSFRSIYLALNSEHEKTLDIIVPFVIANVSIELSLIGWVPENVLGKLIDYGVIARGAYGIPRYIE